MSPPSLSLRLRAWLNRRRRALVQALLHRIVFGEASGGRWLASTRIAPSTCIVGEDALRLADQVYVGPFCFLEASGGITLGEGVQLTSHVCIVTHASHRSQRLLGAAYGQWPAGRPRPGWIAGAVEIGPYAFIGPHTVIEAGSRLGRGCIVRAGSVVRGVFPDHAVIAGHPAVVVGDARDGDAKGLAAHPELREGYAAWAGERPAAQVVAPDDALPSTGGPR
ncbi:MAG: hypothetical protein RLY78_2284 [Pseudomonadota bacterium]